MRQRCVARRMLRSWVDYMHLVRLATQACYALRLHGQKARAHRVFAAWSLCLSQRWMAGVREAAVARSYRNCLLRLACARLSALTLLSARLCKAAAVLRLETLVRVCSCASRWPVAAALVPLARVIIPLALPVAPACASCLPHKTCAWLWAENVAGVHADSVGAVRGQRG